jgi:hypothetical protein
MRCDSPGFPTSGADFDPSVMLACSIPSDHTVNLPGYRVAIHITEVPEVLLWLSFAR